MTYERHKKNTLRIQNAIEGATATLFGSGSGGLFGSSSGSSGGLFGADARKRCSSATSGSLFGGSARSGGTGGASSGGFFGNVSSGSLGATGASATIITSGNLFGASTASSGGASSSLFGGSRWQWKQRKQRKPLRHFKWKCFWAAFSDHQAPGVVRLARPAPASSAMGMFTAASSGGHSFDLDVSYRFEF